MRNRSTGSTTTSARKRCRTSSCSASPTASSRGCAEGRPAPGDRQQRAGAPGSKTETYAALRLLVDNWRWAGVPFYLRTGKRLAKRVSEIAIRFHHTPHLIFRRSPAGVEANSLVIRIQPDEGIALTVAAEL